MLKSLATDEVWSKVSWQHTPTKTSLAKELAPIRTAIEKISAETYPAECSTQYCRSRFLTFLHHTAERIQRKSDNKQTSSSATQNSINLS